MKLSFVIITYNEAAKIGRCLESVQSIADEIIVVDSGSQDNTVAIAQKHGAKVMYRKFDGFINQKNYANSLATGDYIFSLDADEYLSEPLKQWLSNCVNFESYDVLSFNRLNFYCGKWMKWGGWYPDKKVRMWKREKAHWTGALPHEHVTYDSSVQLHHEPLDIMHDAYQQVSQHLNKSVYYAKLASFQLAKKSYRVLFLKLMFSGTFRFFRNIIFKGGILDGWRGVVSAFITTMEINQKYWLALEKKLNPS